MAKLGRPRAEVVITADERDELIRLTKRARVNRALAIRARIVVACADASDTAVEAESDLLALLRPHYARAEQEGRTLLHEIFTIAGDIHVCDTELHITLAPLSSPHRTGAAQALCEILDQTATIFPGSQLRLRFAVRPLPRISPALPGSPAQRSAAPALAPTS